MMQTRFFKATQGKCCFKSSFLCILEAIMYARQTTHQGLNVYWDSQTFQGELSGPLPLSVILCFNT